MTGEESELELCATCGEDWAAEESDAGLCRECEDEATEWYTARNR